MSQTDLSSPAALLWNDEELTDLNTLFEDRSPEALLEWADETFGDKVVLTCSFGGASGMVLLDMVTRLHCAAPIVFLDTDLLFPETYALVEQAEQHYGIAIERRHPTLTLAEQELQEGPELYAHDPDRCCGIRKVKPLAEALSPYDAWISGIRRDQSSTRAQTPLVQWNQKHQVLKLSPLATWTERQVWRYIHANNVPYNVLLDQGYPSIGCTPCTQPANGTASRAGRWAGFAKTECGLHL
jgi:phosphoadenosine phosphosulfate reductase